jgi:hypothetical protein
VTRDYLKYIWDYTKEDICRGTGMADWEHIYSLSVVVTVPAMWTQGAKERTKAAALAAGLPPDLRLVAEPEAAALIVLNERSSGYGLRVRFWQNYV